MHANKAQRYFKSEIQYFKRNDLWDFVFIHSSLSGCLRTKKARKLERESGHKNIYKIKTVGKCFVAKRKLLRKFAKIGSRTETIQLPKDTIRIAIHFLA